MQKKNDLLKAISHRQNRIEFILAVDSGNTNNRFSLFELKRDQFVIEFEKDFSHLSKFNLTDENTIMVQSKVIKTTSTPKFEILFSPNDFKDQNTLLGMPIHYSETLGEDRLIASFEIFKTNPSETTLIIDSGSFTTVDLVTSQGFMGGYILPGKTLLEESYTRGANLHKGVIENTPFLLPQTTDDAINHGAYLSFISPLFHIIDMIRPDKIVLTGFNAELVKKALETNQKFDSNRLLLSPNLILKALTTFAMGVIKNAHSFSR